MSRKKDYGNQLAYDTDRRWITWKFLYEKAYAESEVMSSFDFEEGSEKNNCTLKVSNMIKNERMKKFSEDYRGKFYVSGDADFGKQFDGLREYDFKSIPQLKDYDDFVSEMHQFHNFSLCPKTGNMNAKKGLKSGYKDVFPIFVIYLKKYWECDKSEKIAYVKTYLSSPSYGGNSEKYSFEQKEERYNNEDVPALCAYLDLFDDVFDYCNQVFFFGNKKYKKEIDDLIDNIIRRWKDLVLEKENNLELYVSCAIQYWKLKYKVLIDIYKAEDCNN